MQTHWIFAWDAPLDANETARLETILSSVLANWKAHSVPVKSTFSIKLGQFLFVEALSSSSGCSRDWLREAVKAALDEFGRQLLDANWVFIQNPNGIQCFDFRQLPELLETGAVKPEDTLLDISIVNQNTFEGWEKPVRNSWLARYLPQTTA